MATTTNFGWETPDDTDLVKDGALAMRTLGNAIDASMVDLKGGTTGQVLSKASNTDMDFTWVAQDDSNAIQNAIVDAKGDLIAASAADTPARLAVGNNGETLVADSSASTGLRWQGSIAAGKNVVINGGMDFWQRGTSFSNAHGYNADRWLATGATAVPVQTISRQTLTAGDLAGTGLQYFWRQNVTNVNGATNISNQHRIEGVETFAGQTVTLSFYAKADSSRTISAALNQNFGSGGSGDVFGSGTNFNLTTSWVRYSTTVTLASISGKTIGTGNFLYISLTMPVSTFTIDITGVQLELGSVATAFSRAGGTLAGELAACQRYYWRYTSGTDSYSSAGCGVYTSSTNILYSLRTPVVMRSTPSIGTGGTWFMKSAGDKTISSITGSAAVTNPLDLALTITTSTTATAGQAAILQAQNTSTAFIEASAEL